MLTKTTKFISAVLGAAALSLLAGSSKAADVVDFVGAGSSAQFKTFTGSFLSQNYSSHYSLKSSSLFQVTDSNAPNENAQIGIYWKGSPGAYNIAVFYQVDSTVGVRAYFNSDKVTAPTSGASLPAGDNVGTPERGDVTPPDEVLQAINNLVVNVGITDIAPEDARVATERTINLGYSIANPVKSATNAAASVFPVRFSLSARPFQVTTVGAEPIIVFVNNGQIFRALTGADLNIDSFQLAGFLSGQFDRTSDLALAQGASANPVHTYIAEPMSGTYNTIEYTDVAAIAKVRFTGGKSSGSTVASGGQELNVSATANNPLNEPVNGSSDSGAPVNSGRIRVIGDVERIQDAAADPIDSLGYAFWSARNFIGQSQLRYLTVDGVDPLQDSYTGGTLPTIGSNANITFSSIANGSYPLWSVRRAVTVPNPSNIISLIIGTAITLGLGTDSYPVSSMRVFRSYHATPYTPGGAGAVSNGLTLGSEGAGIDYNATHGGDVGGAVFSINNDQDALNDFGGDLTNLRQ